MNLEQYAAQHAQAAQQEPQAQDTLTADQLAAKLDAEKLYSLMAQIRQAIEEGTAPAAMLEDITGVLFGSSSKEAAAVKAIIDADKYPGGYEWAIADIRQRRSLLNRQARQLEAQAKAIAEDLKRLEESERAIIREKDRAADLDAALLETLTACKGIDPQQPDTLQQLETLYNQHHGNPAAMGLLYGCMADLTRRQYAAGGLDLLQQQAFIDLQARVKAAIG